jgi:hypothetical protein
VQGCAHPCWGEGAKPLAIIRLATLIFHLNFRQGLAFTATIPNI